MKYCLRSRQEAVYLNKADEIKVDFRDRRSIPDLTEKYPEKKIILMCYKDEIIDWSDVHTWNVLCRGNLIMCLSSVDDVQGCKDEDVPFYFGYPIKTFFELNSLKDMGVCYVRLGEPLFFELDKVRRFGIPVRAVPNVAYVDMFPHADGVCGTWIRPEDTDVYEDYVEVFEFEDSNDIKKEQALFRIYAEQRIWPGDLNMLITNFNYPGVNRMILPDIAPRRTNCGQRCQSGGACKICYRAVGLADPGRIRDYMEATDQS